MQARTEGRRRTLWYIPILHTSADMGGLGEAVRKLKTATFGSQRLRHSARSTEKLWDEIERVVRSLPITPGLRIYQDGLPVCGRESEIASDLAQSGSRNHQLLLWLQERGAALMGTESAELLVEEFELAQAAVLSKTATKARSDTVGVAVLEKRDRFIASRINDTLRPGETGLLFLGMLHSVQPYLERDIQILYPVKNF